MQSITSLYKPMTLELNLKISKNPKHSRHFILLLFEKNLQINTYILPHATSE